MRLRAFETAEEFLIGLRSAEVVRRPSPCSTCKGSSGSRRRGTQDEGVGPEQEEAEGTPNTVREPVPVSADDISERYLKKAIAEINELGHEIAQAARAERVPVLGSAIRSPTSCC